MENEKLYGGYGGYKIYYLNIYVYTHEVQALTGANGRVVISVIVTKEIFIYAFIQNNVYLKQL